MNRPPLGDNGIAPWEQLKILENQQEAIPYGEALDSKGSSLFALFNLDNQFFDVSWHP